MPTARNHDRLERALDLRAARLLRSLCRGAALFSLGLALGASGCKKSSPQTQTSAREVQAPATDAESPRPSEKADEKKPGDIEGYAVWYDVPDNSLPKRRAGKDEFTAAHNRLPLGTLVRVTRLANGKSVIVRITDRGVIRRRGMIDLCKEAAEQLEMISDGRARVRLEVLPEEERTEAVPDSKTTAAQP